MRLHFLVAGGIFLRAQGGKIAKVSTGVRRVVVIGGGVSGLATAYFVKNRLGEKVEVTVLESSQRVGGKAFTQTIAGRLVDTGPDAFLSRAIPLAELIDEIGIREECVAPASAGAYVWSKRKLRPLPPGANFGLPEKLVPLVRTGLISIPGALRAGLDLILPKRELPADHSVADLLRPRFGDEVYHRMVEPMLGGVHAGSPEVLSAPSTVPEIEAIAKSGRSMLLTLRKRKRSVAQPSTKPGAALISFKNGISTLTNALAARLGQEVVRTSTPVDGIHFDGTKYTVNTQHGSFEAEEVVLATPAYVSAEILKDVNPTLSKSLREIPYVDSAAVILAFRKSEVPPLPSGTGFLIPPIENEFIVGVTWLSNKWPQLVNDEVVIIRNLVGRYGDDRWTKMNNDQIVAKVLEGLHRMMGITAQPIERIIQPWPKAMPQYVVGHGRRLADIEKELERLPGMHLVGAAYRGVGLAGCVASARVLAEQIVKNVTGE